jgi:hypothetical protein
MPAVNTNTLPKDVVNSFIRLLNEEDFRTARTYTHDDFSFIGVLGTRDGAEAYFKDMEHMRLKYDIKKIFADGDDVNVLYDINMQGTTIFASGWYTVKDGQIKSLVVLFDPRPLLQQAQKK